MNFTKKQRIAVVRAGGIGDIFTLQPVLIDLSNNNYCTDLFCFNYLSSELIREFIGDNIINCVFTLREGIGPFFRQMLFKRYDVVYILSASNESSYSIIKKRLLFYLTFNNSQVLLASRKKSRLKRQNIYGSGYYSKYEAEIILDHYNSTFGRTANLSFAVKVETTHLTPESPFVAILTGTNNSVNRLEIKQWVALIDKLDLKVVLLGGRQEMEYCESIARLASNEVLNLTNELSISQTMGLLSKAEKIYSHDTGLLHLAVHLNVETHAFYSTRDLPGLWMPRGEHVHVHFTQTDCGYCMINTCLKDRICIKETFDKYLKNVY